VPGALNQGVGERGTEHLHHRRPRGPLGFQALIALDAAGNVPDGFALFPDQGHAVDAAIALVEEGQIGDETIGLRDPKRPQGPLAEAENRDKLCARRRYRRHAHQPAERGGYEHAPPLVLQVHTCPPTTLVLVSVTPPETGAADLPMSQTRR
jgi:hypothetical protein